MYPTEGYTQVSWHQKFYSYCVVDAPISVAAKMQDILTRTFVISLGFYSQLPTFCLKLENVFPTTWFIK
jgi:hypothetical protein